ncbi:ATPase [Aureococcus anophagefferens]|nr:ATPase [Aureococcus anophagefferens]
MPLAWNAGKIGVYQTHQHNSFVYKPPQPHRDQRENSCRANALFGKSLSERRVPRRRAEEARYPPQPTPSEMSLSCRAARRRDVRHFSTSLARQGSRENFGGAGRAKPRAARVDGTPIPITRAFSTLLEAGKPRRRKKTRRAGMAWSPTRLAREAAAGRTAGPPVDGARPGLPNMGKAFTAASTLFIIAELLSAYQQYFDTDATQMDGLARSIQGLYSI